MTHFTVVEEIQWMGSEYANWFDLALALREKYGDRILEARSQELNFSELKEEEITPEIQKAYNDSLETPEHLYTNI